MRSGALNNRITIQQQSVTQDTLGQPVSTWTDLATIWADVKYNVGLEHLKADAVTNTVKASVRIRYRTDVTPGMRVVRNLVPHNITAVLPDATGRQYVDLVCEQVS